MKLTAEQREAIKQAVEELDAVWDFDAQALKPADDLLPLRAERAGLDA